jgi:NDP-sugar pyrophosphorylase family protein
MFFLNYFLFNYTIIKRDAYKIKHKSNIRTSIWDYNNLIENKSIYEDKIKIKKILNNKF